MILLKIVTDRGVYFRLVGLNQYDSMEGTSPYGNASNLELCPGKNLKFKASEMAGNSSKV